MQLTNRQNHIYFKYGCHGHDPFEVTLRLKFFKPLHQMIGKDQNHRSNVFLFIFCFLNFECNIEPMSASCFRYQNFQLRCFSFDRLLNCWLRRR